jgi:hypothetical protein
MDFIKNWEKGEKIPSYQQVARDSLKTFFLFDYRDPVEEDLVKIWKRDNNTLHWRISSLFNIFDFSDKLKPEPLDELIRFQLIDQKIDDDPRLTTTDVEYLNAKKPNPNFVKTYPARTVPNSLYEKFITQGDFKNQKYFRPESIGDLSLEFIDYLCLVKAKYSFTADEFKNISDDVSKYIVLTKSKDNKLWEYVDYVRDPWIVAIVPDKFAFMALLQNVEEFVEEVALAKTYRLYLQTNDSFYESFLSKLTYPSWVEIQNHLLDKDRNSPLPRRYFRSVRGKAEKARLDEEERLREVRRKEDERNRQEALRQESARLAVERQAKLLDRLHEEQVQRTIDERERAKALYEKYKIANQYQEAVRSGFGNSDFGKAVAYFDLRQDFTCDELKKAYRRKSLQVHPDKQGGSRDEFERVTHYFQLLEHICKK